MEAIWPIGVSIASPLKKGSDRGDAVANDTSNANYQKYQKNGLPLAYVQRERSFFGVLENTETTMDKIKSSKLNISILSTSCFRTQGHLRFNFRYGLFTCTETRTK